MTGVGAAGVDLPDGTADTEALVFQEDDERLLAYFGAVHPTIAQFVRLLADEGVTRGLIGPHEAPRLWERHILNCAAVAQLLPSSGTLVDVGSGSGLPGVVLAVMRPDLQVILLEPMERRAAWLVEVVAALGLTSTEVVRGRAEEVRKKIRADVVTARAVAPMDRLAGWTLPLLHAGGVLLAMKGRSATDELAAATKVIQSLGGGPGEVLEAASIVGVAPTTVIRITREMVLPHEKSASRPAEKRKRRR